MFFNVSSLVEDKATGINTWVLFLAMVAGVTMCPMMPRFIISVRELYDRDHRRGWQGVDTRFGVLSQPIANRYALVSSIAFPDIPAEQDQVVEGDVDELPGILLESLSVRDNSYEV